MLRALRPNPTLRGRRGGMRIYLAACGLLGTFLGIVILMIVIVAPVATAAGAVLRIQEELTRAVCNIPVASDWLSASCDPDEDVQAFVDEAEAAGVNTLLRATFDCSNVPEAERKQRLCDQRSLDQIEHSAIPPEKAGLIPIFVDAGLDHRVPWGVLAALAGARTNFGEENCSAGGRSGGFYRFSRAEWDRYKTDGGRLEMERDGRCWDIPDASAAAKAGRSPYALFDSRPDGKMDPRDPADAAATMARLLADNGAAGQTTWDRYNGSDAAACPVNPDIDGEITPAPAVGTAADGAAGGVDVSVGGDEPSAQPEAPKAKVGQVAAGGRTQAGVPATAELLGFTEHGSSGIGGVSMGSVVAFTRDDKTVYLAKVGQGQATGRDADALPAGASKLSIGHGQAAEVTVSEPLGRVAITKSSTVAQVNAKVKAIARANPVVGGGSANDASIIAQIKSVIQRRAPGSPLLPHVEYAVAYSRQTGLDPRFIFAIAGAESSFASDPGSPRIHNAWGMGPGINYPNWEAGFRAAIDNLNGNLYRGSSLFTIPQIQERWCPVGAANDPNNLNSNWRRNVTIIYTELGGDATKSVFTDEVASVPGAAPTVPAAGQSGTDGAPYSGPRPTDKISKAIGVRVGESVPHTACYIAQVHQWYEAITSYGGGAPPVGSAPQDGTLRARIVQIARQELQRGVAEPEAYGRYSIPSGWPWCAAFQSWVWTQAGVDFQVANRYYSGAAALWAETNSQIKPPTAVPEPGDAAIFDRDSGGNGGLNTPEKALARVKSPGGGMTDHVNIVEKVYPDGSFDTIGGNQGGGVVSRNSRLTTRSGYGAGIVAFASPVRPGADVPAPAGSDAGGDEVVWVQGGHVAPLEPGYTAQSGASGEAAWSERAAKAIIAKLKADNIDARFLPGKVDPVGVRGSVFLSVHYDTPQGASQVGFAVSDPNWGENYYHGEGTGTASARPYADSAPHRAGATKVTAQVQSRSRKLADILSARWRAIYKPANGARAAFKGVQPATGNPRMNHYYGYFRVNTDARVLLEAGAGGTDAAFLRRTDLLANTAAAAVREYLRG